MLRRLALGVGGVGTPGAAAGAYVVNRYAEDSAFRQWVRSDYAWVEPHIDEFLKEYFPRAHQEIRIEEDLAGAGDEDTYRREVHVRAAVNPGRTPLPKQPVSEGAAKFYATEFCPPEPESKPLDAVLDAELAPPKSQLTVALDGPLNDASAQRVSTPDASLDAMAPDEAEEDWEGTEPHDGTAWSCIREDEATVWASAAAPDLPARLEVPDACRARTSNARHRSPVWPSPRWG